MEVMRRYRWIIVFVCLLLGGVAALAQDEPGEDAVPESQFAGQIAAPAFPTGLDWVNVPAPLALEDLRGKIVLLDFWTYGCINCIHMIPVLHALEEKYAQELVVIGVHSAKFENEGQTENIREIVQRYDMAHPVINDSEFLVWQTYAPFGVNAWPTFAVIDPRGNLLAVQAGEIPYEAFDRVIGGMVEYFDSTGELSREPITVAPEGADDPNSLLRYPGKVLVDAAGDRLFIADSSHHRVIIADLTTYEVLDVIGTGARGFDDGAYTSATFDSPQGMTLTSDGGTLYIADVNNHAIRAVDLAEQTVRTIAGTGEIGRMPGFAGMLIERVPMRSPWDVLLSADDRLLYVAMAGTHQLWVIDLEAKAVIDVVGSGREGMLNDTFEASELAQPSGLHLEGDLLYFADSESSTIRVANVAARTVAVVSGTPDNNLFDFGDIDGELGVSRLQHPLGVTAADDGLLYIADTYNSRIKRIDPATNVTTTVYGTDEAGFRDGSSDAAQFHEPGGLDYADGKLYVADTNNHAIRVIDLAANTVSTVTFTNPEVLQLADEITIAGGNLGIGESLTLDAQTVAPGEGEIVLTIALPEGYKINDLAPSAFAWNSDNGALAIDEAAKAGRLEGAELRVPVTFSAGEDTLSGIVTVYYCEAVNETLCFIDEVALTLPVTVSDAASETRLQIERSIVPPQQGVGGF